MRREREEKRRRGKTINPIGFALLQKAWNNNGEKKHLANNTYLCINKRILSSDQQGKNAREKKILVDGKHLHMNKIIQSSCRPQEKFLGTTNIHIFFIHNKVPPSLLQIIFQLPLSACLMNCVLSASCILPSISSALLLSTVVTCPPLLLLKEKLTESDLSSC
jgi:hypothetical protein